MPRFGATGQRLVKLVVHVTISPIFAWFERFDDRVFCCVIVIGRVFIWRRVAAADVAALFAEAKVHPMRADLQTIFTAVCAGRNVADGAYVFAVLH